jgi:V/A-type H+-transporting ATPase subunit D
MNGGATRTELLARRERLSLAARGRELLEHKREALLRALAEAYAEAVAGAERLEEAVERAEGALAEAVAHDGREVVRSAGFAARRPVSLEVEPMVLSGVRLVRIRGPALVRRATERGYGLTTTSPWIDGAAAAYETLLERSIEEADRELRLRRLAEELRRVTVRVNALDRVVIPSLRSDASEIARALDEREREEVYRLKRLKERGGA